MTRVRSPAYDDDTGSRRRRVGPRIAAAGQLLLWLWFGAGHARGALSALTVELQANLRGARVEHQRLASEVQAGSTELGELGERIEALKRTESDLGWFQKRRLQRLLGESLERSRRLEELERRRAEVKDRWQALETRLAAEVDVQLRATVAELRQDPNPASDELLRDYLHYRALKMERYGDLAVQEYQVVEFEGKELDSPQELVEKAAIVRGIREQFATRIEQQVQRIHELRDDLELSREMSQLIEEQDLFEPLTAVASRRPKASNAADAGGADSPASETPTGGADLDGDFGRGGEPAEAGSRDLFVRGDSLDLYGGLSIGSSLESRLQALETERAILVEVSEELLRQEGALVQQAKRLRDAESQ